MYKSDKLKVEMTSDKLWFGKKLDVINEEFDAYIGAAVADLILKQHTLREQAKRNLESIGTNVNNEQG